MTHVIIVTPHHGIQALTSCTFTVSRVLTTHTHLLQITHSHTHSFTQSNTQGALPECAEPLVCVMRSWFVFTSFFISPTLYCQPIACPIACLLIRNSLFGSSTVCLYLSQPVWCDIQSIKYTKCSAWLECTDAYLLKKNRINNI